MPFSDLDDPPSDAPAPQYDARRRVYFWTRGDHDPARGVLAPEVFDAIVFLARFTHFETRAGAVAAVDVVRLRAEYKVARDAG